MHTRISSLVIPAVQSTNVKKINQLFIYTYIYTISEQSNTSSFGVLEFTCVTFTEHTHTTVLRLYGFCPGQPGKASTRKVKPIWILLKQETVSGSGIS